MFKRHQPSTPAGPSPSTQQKNRPQLSSLLRVEVRSPGFSSRVSALINEGKEAEKRRRSTPLKPPLGAANFNPKYSGFGSRPKVSFDKSPLPLLSTKNSSKVGPRSPVTLVKVTPSSPYSPFKSSLQSRSPFTSSAPISGAPTPSTTRAGTSENSDLGVTDPRRVLVALQELSRTRKRGHQRNVLKCANDVDDELEEEEEEEECGSKRARRDSSSSIGSSLSMEMPPLFSNGVIGQTTSQLVSRETDISLNSLLSRSQSIFGPQVKPQQPMQTQAQVNSVKKQKTILSAIMSSLSSSINMKRHRHDSSTSDSSSSDDSDLDTSKGRISAPGTSSHRKQKRQKLNSPKSSEAPSTAPETKKKVTFDEKVSPPKPKPVVTAVGSMKKFVLPTLSEIVGGKKLSPKKVIDESDSIDLKAESESRKQTLSSIEALDADRKKDEERAKNLLSVFETEPEKTTASTEAQTVLSAAVMTTAALSTVPVMSSTVVFGSTLTATSSKPEEPKPEVKTVTASLEKETEKTATPEVSSPASSSTGTISTPSSSSAAPSPAAFSFGLPAAKTTTSSVPSSTPSSIAVPLSTDKPPATSLSTVSTGFSFGGVTSAPLAVTTSSQVTGFSFGGATTSASPLTTLSTSAATASVPSIPSSGFSFGGLTPSTTASTTAPSSVGISAVTTAPTTSATPSLAKPSFSFSPSSTLATTSSAAAVPAIFSFGTGTDKKNDSAVSAVEGLKPTFEFGSCKLPSTKSFGIGATEGNAAPKLSFTFGDAVKKVDESSSSKTTQSSLFSVGAIPKTTSAPEPPKSFSFGTEKKDSPFTFGDSSTAPKPALGFSFGKTESETSKPQSSVFAFGQGGAENATSKGFQFGKTETSTDTSNSSSLFQFGANSQQTVGASADNSKQTFPFVTPTQKPAEPPKPVFQFGEVTKQTTEPSKPSFQFGQSSQQPAPGKSFSFGGASAAAGGSSSSDTFKFGASGGTQPSVDKPTFGFGGGEAKSTSFSFGGSTTQPPQSQQPSGVFTFGASQAPTTTSNTTGMFQFGATAQSPPAPSFGTPAQPQAPAQGGFNFGGSSISTPSSFSFGGASAGPGSGGFAFGAPAAPTFGAVAAAPAAPATPGQGSMFSIGAGTTPKGRTIARARRTRR